MLKRDKITELFRDDDDSQHKRKSLLITTFIICSATVIFTILGFTTKLPKPMEEGQFVLIGLEPDGEVVDKPVPVEEVVEPIEEIVEEVEPTPEPVQEVAEKTLETSTDAEAPEVNASKNNAPVTPPTEPQTPPEEPPTQKPTEPEKSSDADELAKLLQQSQSKPKGVPKGNDRKIGQDVIKFNPETGFGSVGVVNGSGRAWVKMPPISDLTQENGDVYIKVTVDRDGNVIEARNDLSKSTTTNSLLIDKALASARGSKFDKLENGPSFTEEILLFSFRLE